MTLTQPNQALHVTLEEKKGLRQGDTYSDALTGMPFIYVEGGCFEMGKPASEEGSDVDERPHRACVNQGSGQWVGRYEVTQGQWQAVMGSNPSHFKSCGSNCPVETVSWDDVQEFIRKLNSRTGKSFRLPTDAEWVYACRSGGKSQEYCGESTEDSVGWHVGNSDGETHRVGLKQPDGLGLYDMSGNVWEWNCTMYDDDNGFFLERSDLLAPKFQLGCATLEAPASHKGSPYLVHSSILAAHATPEHWDITHSASAQKKQLSRCIS